MAGLIVNTQLKDTRDWRFLADFASSMPNHLMSLVHQQAVLIFFAKCRQLSYRSLQMHLAGVSIDRGG